MPLYDFRCTRCGRDFELALTVRDYEQKAFACPHCQSKEVERVIASVGVITSKKS